MRILFVHQNAPGQFRHLAPYLARDDQNQVAFIGQGERANLGKIRWVGYPKPKQPSPGTHPYLRRADEAVRRSQSVARACMALCEEGFKPDIVIAHPGWGETMFLLEVLPRAAILSYCEMYYRPFGQDTNYIPETAIDLDGRCRVRAWNADLLAALSIMDRGLSPTRWQREQHPPLFQPKIEVLHDGIDLAQVAPDPSARFCVPGGPTFQPGDEVVTFVARHLEPIRGFTLLVHALPELLRRRPTAHVVVCGGDGVSYGRPAPDGLSWREHMLRDVALNLARVHFVGTLPRANYLDLLRVSALHLYLTVPFVLSWSCVEALASGCLVLGSDVAPVREVIEDGVNGYLVDARDAEALARQAADLLAARHTLAAVRRAARERVAANFELRSCLLAQRRLVADLVP